MLQYLESLPSGDAPSNPDAMGYVEDILCLLSPMQKGTTSGVERAGYCMCSITLALDFVTGLCPADFALDFCIRFSILDFRFLHEILDFCMRFLH